MKHLHMSWQNNAWYFQRLSQNRTMSQPAWLVFLNGSISLEHFFHGINIPFDCKFLVAQPRGNSIVLMEVYRVAEGTSLMTHSYGLWESNNGTIWATTKLYERRNNLYGVRMRGVLLHVSGWSELCSLLQCSLSLEIKK